MRLIAAVLLCLAAPLHAQDAAQRAADQLLAAQTQLQAADGATDRIAALTATVQAYEAGLSAMRAGQREIALTEASLQEQLTTQREGIARLLGVLATISKTPQPVQRAHPSGPIDTARAGMLVASITPALEIEAADLRSVLAQTQTLRRAQEDAARTLEDGLAGAQTARAALGQAASERRDLPQRFVDDPVQTALLLASAETLDDFAAQIAQSNPSATQDMAPQANLPLPVAGVVLADDGSGRPGVRLGAAPRALVTSPIAATVLFQGELLDYGTVVMVEPATDILFVFAGFEDVFVQAGQVLPAGAPIGLLPAAQRFNDGNLTENSGIETGEFAQSLYLEVRDGQGPQETGAWFALE